MGCSKNNCKTVRTVRFEKLTKPVLNAIMET